MTAKLEYCPNCRAVFFNTLSHRCKDCGVFLEEVQEETAAVAVHAQPWPTTEVNREHQTT